MAAISRLRGAFRPRRGALVRFSRNRDGATAVEFAIVAVPFIALMFAIIETAITFFAGQVLETAVADASRLIMTGQAQQQNFDATRFKQEICDRMTAVFDCDGVKVDVKTYDAFNKANTGKPTTNNAVDASNFGYQPGNGGDIVVVRAIFEWPVIAPALGIGLSNLSNGKRLLMATAAFRNEPF